MRNSVVGEENDTWPDTEGMAEAVAEDTQELAEDTVAMVAIMDTPEAAVAVAVAAGEVRLGEAATARASSCEGGGIPAKAGVLISSECMHSHDNLHHVFTMHHMGEPCNSPLQVRQSFFLQ